MSNWMKAVNWIHSPFSDWGYREDDPASSFSTVRNSLMLQSEGSTRSGGA